MNFAVKLQVRRIRSRWESARAARARGLFGSSVRLVLVQLAIVASLVAGFAAQALAKEDKNVKARNLFEEGKKAYSDGDFGSAVDSFKQAQKLRPTPILDYDLGLAYQRQGEAKLARKAYRAYLDRTPDAENRSEIEDRIEALHASDDSGEPPAEPDAAAIAALVIVDPWPSEAPAPKPAVAATPTGANTTDPAIEVPPAPEPEPEPIEPTPPPKKKGINIPIYVPIAVGALAVAALAGGAGSLGWASYEYDQLTITCAPHCTHDDRNAVQAGANAGYALLAIGAAAVAADAALWALVLIHKKESPRYTSRRPRWTIAPTGAPGYQGAVMSGEF